LRGHSTWTGFEHPCPGKESKLKKNDFSLRLKTLA
jgi:hypothetical protein